jgi:hypothetical protein
MASFTPVVATKKLIFGYGINGEIDLIRKFDFSEFTRDELKEMRDEIIGHYHYKEEREDSDIQLCIDYIDDLYWNKVVIWESDDYRIYANCYQNDSLYSCVHKVFNKATGEYQSVYCFELAKICAHKHFQRWK